jgi:two-component system, NtrC family, response regulator HydG
VIGQSVLMRRIMKWIERVAPSDFPVLITGESGTGKEETAKLIHGLSRRKDAPFLAVNCAALAPTLIESELFGHEKGAFTGADRRKPGLFESADGGTLFLDELTEMPCETQAKLLRVLEDGRVLPVGGTKPVGTNARVLAASNQNLEREVRAKRLREDLFHRLYVCLIHLPPLRDRIEDLPLLIDEFLRKTIEKLGRRIEGVDDECMTALARYRWPGNIRELLHVIEGAALRCDSTTLTVNDLPPHVRGVAGPDSSFVVQVGDRVDDVVDELVWRTVERERNKTRAAKILGIGLRTVYTRLEHRDGYPTDGASNGRPRRPGNGRS